MREEPSQWSIENTVRAALPCKHGRYEKHRLLALDGPFDLCEDWREIKLRPAGAMARSWFCKNCGGDHGGPGCDNPDFETTQFYEIIGYDVTEEKEPIHPMDAGVFEVSQESYEWLLERLEESSNPSAALRRLFRDEESE